MTLRLSVTMKPMGRISADKRKITKKRGVALRRKDHLYLKENRIIPLVQPLIVERSLLAEYSSQ